MAISASSITSSSTLNTLRTEFNNLVTDVTAIEGGTISYTTLNTTNTNTTILNVKEDGTIIFEGATDDGFETTLTVVDPTADRTITFPNETGTVHTTGGDTTHTNIIIADGGNIGSASDTNAIGISSGGVVSVTATTANTSTTDGALTIAGGLGVAADVSIGDDLRLISDGAVLNFGADSDVTLTHVADTGILLNGTSVIQFNDASQSIGAPSNAILDINATDEIELNATLLDVNANINASGTYTGAGLMTTGGNIVIPDAGTIGSASDTNAIGISSGGVVSVTATTANTSASDGALTVAGGLGVAADVSIGDDLRLISDSSVLSFGADSDTTLTHTDGSGLTLNSTNKLMFNDASQFIQGASATVLDIAATDEIELTATLIDIVGRAEVSGNLSVGGNLDVTGTLDLSDSNFTNVGSIALDSISGDGDANSSITFSGSDVITIATGGSTAATFNASQVTTLSGNLIIPDAGTIGSASDTDAIAIGSDGDITLTQDLELQHDGAILSFGANDEIALTHVHNTGLLLTDSGGSPTLQLHDAGESLSSDGSKLILTSNSVAFNFPNADGTDGQVLKTDGSGTLSFITASANTPSSADGQALGSTSLEWSDLFLADASTIQFGNDQDVILTHVADTGLLLSGTNVIQFNDASQNIGAPSNAILDINATDEIELNATLLDVNANINASGTYTGAGLMTTGGNIVVPDAGTIGSASDVDAIAIGSDGDITLTQDLELQHDGAILSFGANDEIALTHVHNTGLLLTDSGGTPTLQLHDANEAISSDGGHLIFTSNGVTFDFPSADGSNGQMLVTDGGGVLSFADVTASGVAADDISIGDAAILLTTSSGNITVDAAANDSDIIFKGTDGGADTTFLTIDGSDAGKLLPNNGMDLNGKELILDADADTSITADTDDTIDIRIAGADDFQFTANSFNVLSGSTLTIDSGATIANSGTATGFVTQRPNVRPLIINGDMEIAQRTASEVTGLGDGDEGYVTLDRIRHTIDGTTAGRFTSSQGTVSDLPGFVKCIQIDCTTADTSIAAGEGFNLEYKFEGKDLTLLEKGHSTARPFTIAFYAKADAAVTYSVEFKDTDNNRHCTRAFTTTTGWTRHVLNFPADTTGKYNHDVNHSASLRFWLHAGSNFTSGTAADVFQGVTTANTVRDIGSIFASTDRTIQITGVQMEIGTFTSDTIPDFQHETFAESKTRCQRYFIGDSELVPTTQLTAATAIQFTPQFRTEMRTAPTATAVATTGFGLVGGSYTTTTLAVSNIGVNGGRAAVNIDTSTGELKQLCQQGLPVTLDAEL